MKKEAVATEAWMKDVSPSTQLRQGFGRQVKHWVEFAGDTERSSTRNPPPGEPILDAEGRGTVTLLYSAHDVLHNCAFVLRDYLVERLGTLPPRKARRKWVHREDDQPKEVLSDTTHRWLGSKMSALTLHMRHFTGRAELVIEPFPVLKDHLHSAITRSPDDRGGGS